MCNIQKDTTQGEGAFIPGVRKEEIFQQAVFLQGVGRGVSKCLTLPQNLGGLWLMTKIPPLVSFRTLSAGRLIWDCPSWLNVECAMFIES